MKIRPPVKRHGGKHYLAPWIIGHMPPHRTYVEPFLGGGSVLLNKPRAAVEVASDLDAGLIEMWRCLAEEPRKILDFIGTWNYSEDAWKTACLRDGRGPISQIVRSRMSRGGLGKTFGASTRSRGGRDEYENSWETFKAVHLPAICERTRGVQFLCADARIACIDHDADDTLIYADPPYLHGTRTAKDTYDHEMDDEAHRKFLVMLRMRKARAMISGYRSDLYDATLKGWRRIDRDMPNHAGQGKAKGRRVECLWLNF
jgi:DNA adenine methylase